MKQMNLSNYFRWSVAIGILAIGLVLGVNVFTSQHLDISIRFQGEEWRTVDGYVSQESWYTTESELEFIINVESYIDTKNEITVDMDIEELFVLSFTFNEEPLSENEIIIEPLFKDDYFIGEYIIHLPKLETDGILNGELFIHEENQFEIPTTEEIVRFEVIKDTVQPEISFTGIENNTVIYELADDELTLMIDIEEVNFSEENTTVFVNEIQEEVVFESIAEAIHRTKLHFSEDGSYEIEVITEDPVGHIVTESFVFHINQQQVSIEQMHLDGDELSDQHYLSGETLTFEVHSGIAIEELEVKVLFNEEPYEPELEVKQMDEKSQEVIIDFNKTGHYQIDVEVTDRYSLRSTVHQVLDRVIDLEAPKLRISDQYSQELKSIYKEPISIEVEITDAYLENHSIVLMKGEKTITSTIVEDTATKRLEQFELEEDGVYELKVEAIDKANQQSSHEQTFVIDREGLHVEFVDDNGEALVSTYLEPITVSLDVFGLTLNHEKTVFKLERFDQDEALWDLVIDQTDFVEKEKGYHLEKSLSDGKYRMFFYAEDKLSRSHEESHEFMIDSKDPIIHVKKFITHPVQSEWINEVTLNNYVEFFVEDEFLEAADLAIRYSSSEDEVSEEIDVLTFGSFNDEGEFEFEENFVFHEGKYTFTINAIDQVGREAEEVIKELVVDDTAPVITIEGIEDGMYYQDSQQATVTVEEANYDEAEVTITLEGKDGLGNSIERDEPVHFKMDQSMVVKTVDFPTEGRYQLIIEAIDKAGNDSEQRMEIVIDQNAPLISVDGVSDNQHYNQDRPFELVVEDFFLDETTLTVLKDDQPYDIGVLTSNRPNNGLQEDRIAYDFTEEGDYEVFIEATDLAGYKTVKSLKFVIDKTAPVVTYSGIEPSNYYDKPQTLIIEVIEQYYKENNVQLNVKHNGEDITETLENYTLNDSEVATLTHLFEEDGYYEIALTAEDKAGNKISPISFFFEIDQTNPVIIINNLEDGKHYNSNRTMSLVMEDQHITSYDVKVEKDNKAYVLPELEVSHSNYQGSTAMLDYTFKEEGVYHIAIEVTDASGNKSERTKSFTIDKTPPVINSDPLIESYITYSDIVAATINQLIPIEVVERHIDRLAVTVRKETSGEVTTLSGDTVGQFVKDGNRYTYEFNQSIFQDDANYQVRVHVQDIVGHEVEKSVSFTVDNTKPVISHSRVPAYNNSDVIQEIEVKELNYNTNNVSIDVFRKNTNGSFVRYNHPSIREWKNNGKVSKLSLLFNEDGDYRVVTNATDRAGNTATERVSNFTVDYIAPVLSFSGFEDGSHYNSTRRVVVKQTDQNIDLNRTSLIIQRRLGPNGRFKALNFNEKFVRQGNDAILNKRFNTDLEGTFRLLFSATDRAGNQALPINQTFTIDKTPPVLTASGVEDGSYYSSPRRVTFGVDEVNFDTNHVGFHVTKNGSEYTATVEGDTNGSWRNRSRQSRLNYTFDTDGTYTIKMDAKDKANNQAIPVNKTFTIDQTAPSIAITGVEEDSYNNTNVNVNVTIEDVNFDKNTISVTKDGQPYNVGTFQVENRQYQNSIARLNYLFSEEGNYTITVQSIDLSGNRAEENISFVIDKTPPVITPKMDQQTVIEDGVYINKIFTPIFELDLPEDDTIDYVSLNGGPNIAGRIPAATSEGVYNYEVIASDRAGNTTTLNIGFTIDTTRPELTISGVVDGFFNNRISPIVTYDDIHLDEENSFVTLNNQPFTNGTTISEEGHYQLKAHIRDLANNVSERTIIFTVDKTAPRIQFVEAINDQYFNHALIPEFIIEDMTGYEIIELTLNGEPYNIGDEISEDGKYVLYFEAIDQAGNLKQLTIEFIIDTKPPHIIFDGIEDNQRFTESVNLSISLEDYQDMIKFVSVNGEDFVGEIMETEFGQEVMIEFTDISPYEVEVLAADMAGNETVQTLNFEITEKSIFVRVSENTPLLYSLMGGTVFLLVGGGYVFIKSRKKPVDAPREEE
ncbi:hypothetical protein J2T56_001412 [Natronobacillus azotifigens]|uniref:Ig-like domain-containing protein n=1 Tax=Natronobacillus azotifigens TaxID=472978 RepID=A0A9J6RCS0_9BACI|nr:Ig-like domain-containing protein [Natronobacillus azotifigens]MCZ0703150.1 Ig-like domain-containing protein [Natronobacillus azotifigens]